MTQRSIGIFPREKFDLDENMKLTTSPTPCAIELTSISIIRVVVLGADYTAPVGDGEDGRIDVTVGGKVVSFGQSDLDVNGVGLAYLRGSLCDANDNVSYTLVDGDDNTGTGGSYTVEGVYLDAVDNIG